MPLPAKPFAAIAMAAFRGEREVYDGPFSLAIIRPNSRGLPSLLSKRAEGCSRSVQPSLSRRSRGGKTDSGRFLQRLVGLAQRSAQPPAWGGSCWSVDHPTGLRRRRLRDLGSQTLAERRCQGRAKVLPLRLLANVVAGIRNAQDHSLTNTLSQPVEKVHAGTPVTAVGPRSRGANHAPAVYRPCAPLRLKGSVPIAHLWELGKPYR